MHYYQFNIADYRKDTVHLSRVEHSIYRDLIDWYYIEETPIPKETQVVIRRLRLDTEQDVLALNNVLSDFFSSLDDGFHHARIDAEIADYRNQCATNKVNGAKGGRPRGKKTQSVTSGLPVVSQVGTEINPNHEPLTTNHKPIHTAPAAQLVDGDFENFYSAYPKKVAKPAALKAWKSAKLSAGSAAVILTDIATRSNSRDWLKEDGKFIPNPATYLNQRRWEDVAQQPAMVGDVLAGAI